MLPRCAISFIPISLTSAYKLKDIISSKTHKDYVQFNRVSKILLERNIKFHHLGYACHDINLGIEYITQFYQVRTISDTIYDQLQNAQLCIVDFQDDSRIELVAGEVVQNLLDKFDDFKLYHVCYEVPNIYTALQDHTNTGATIVSEPKPAILFEGRLVCFIHTPFGLIELLQC